MKQPLVLIIAGPNGAGKTTTAMHLLPNVLKIKHFVNADMIAKGLSPFDPTLAEFQAGKLMVEQIETLIKQRESFTVETILASRSYISMLKKCCKAGYLSELLFIALPNPELAKSRVALRVMRGGHDIPKETIERRFYLGLKNLFHLYMPLMDEWTMVESINIPIKQIAEKKLYNEEIKFTDRSKFEYYQKLVKSCQ